MLIYYNCLFIFISLNFLEQLSYYGFIGRILGKALYEGILVDAAFAGFFLNKWLGRTSYCMCNFQLSIRKCILYLLAC